MQTPIANVQYTTKIPTPWARHRKIPIYLQHYACKDLRIDSRVVTDNLKSLISQTTSHCLICPPQLDLPVPNPRVNVILDLTIPLLFETCLLSLAHELGHCAINDSHALPIGFNKPSPTSTAAASPRPTDSVKYVT
jgi:hypothetical protein